MDKRISVSIKLDDDSYEDFSDENIAEVEELIASCLDKELNLNLATLRHNDR